MSVYLLNATSLAKPNAVQLLATEISMAQCDCALITETWFTKNHIDSVVGVSHYSLYRRDVTARLEKVVVSVSMFLRELTALCFIHLLMDWSDLVSLRYSG